MFFFEHFNSVRDMNKIDQMRVIGGTVCGLLMAQYGFVTGNYSFSDLGIGLIMDATTVYINRYLNDPRKKYYYKEVSGALTLGLVAKTLLGDETLFVGPILLAASIANSVSTYIAVPEVNNREDTGNRNVVRQRYPR